MVWEIARFFAAACPDKRFLGFPAWYRGLQCDDDGGVKLSSLNDTWKIVLNVTEMALRLAAVLAVIFIIIGAIQLIISSGEPEPTARAKHIIANAIIGLAISVLATVIVSFIAGRF